LDNVFLGWYVSPERTRPQRPSRMRGRESLVARTLVPSSHRISFPRLEVHW